MTPDVIHSHEPCLKGLLEQTNNALRMIESGLIIDVPADTLLQVYRDLNDIKTKLMAITYKPKEVRR